MTETAVDQPEALREHKGLVPASAALMVAGFLTTFLSPMLATSFANEFDFGIEQAGLLVACGTAGVAVSALGVLPFIDRLNRRTLGIVGVLVAAAGMVATGFAASFGVVLVLQILVGLGAGLAYAAANSALAYSRVPERAFSIVTISWLVVGAAMLSLGPVLHSAWPKVGIYLAIAAAELLCLVLIVRLPDVRNLPKDNESTEELEQEVDPGEAEASPSPLGSRRAALLLVAAVLVMNIGNLVIWTYAEDIGEKAGLSPQATATFLGLSQLVGLVGAGITLLIGDRVGKMMIFVPAVVLLAVGNLLVGTAANPAMFIIGFLLINITFFCLSPLLLALAAELDSSSGRLVVIVGAATLIAGAIAPAIGGFIAGSDEVWSRLGYTAFALALISLPVLIGPVRAAKRRHNLEAALATHQQG